MNERLFFLREQENLTQQELAEIFKVSRSLVSKWERDLITITLKQLNNYANYFNVSLDYICCIKDEVAIVEDGTIDKLKKLSKDLESIVDKINKL